MEKTSLIKGFKIFGKGGFNLLEIKEVVILFFSLKKTLASTLVI